MLLLSGIQAILDFESMVCHLTKIKEPVVTHKAEEGPGLSLKLATGNGQLAKEQ